MAKLCTVVLLLAVFTSISFSQKASEMSVIAGSAKEEPSELVSKEIRDANGITCAGLIIFSDLKGLTYQSYNGVVKVNSNAGKDFLFLSPDERVVEVYCFGYTPLKIILNENGIKLKSGQTWSLKITGEKKLELLPVNIVVKPADSKIFIDGKDKGSMSSHQLSSGKHSVKIERNGYITYEDSIDVSLDNSLFNITLLQQDVIPITISSIPQGAKIYIDDVDRGETDKNIFRLPGSFKLRLTKSGYSDTSVTISVNDKSQKNYTFTLAKNTGMLRLTVQPSDAQVLVDKENVGERREIDVVPGTHKIEVSKENYYPFSDFVELQKNKPLEKNIILNPIIGGLLLSVSPLDAAVKMIRNGVVMQEWQGLKQQKNIMIGSYELHISSPGYDPITKFVTIKENESTTEDVVLKKAVFGSVLITSTPSYATISLLQNGSVLQTIQSGVVTNSIRPGTYQVRVSYSGYESDEFSISVTEGVTTTKQVELDQIIYTPPVEKENMYFSLTYGLDSEPKGGDIFAIGYSTHFDMFEQILYGEFSNMIFFDKMVKEQSGVTIQQNWGGMSFGFGASISFTEDSYIEPFAMYTMRLTLSGKEKVTGGTSAGDKELDSVDDLYSSRSSYGLNFFLSDAIWLKVGLFNEGNHFEDSKSSLGKINDNTGKLISMLDKRRGYFAEFAITF